MPKKNKKLRICVDFRKHNATTKKDAYFYLFSIEVINIVARHKVYKFLNGFYGYHNISITPKDQYKTAFVTNSRVFVWVVMPLGIKNGPPTYQRAVTKAFWEYIDVFMKTFLNDFTIFNELSTHFLKLKKCFLKFREYDISLNPKKCAFMVCSGTILGFIVSKEGKTLDPKKIEALIKMPVPKTP